MIGWLVELGLDLKALSAQTGHIMPMKITYGTSLFVGFSQKSTYCSVCCWQKTCLAFPTSGHNI